MQMRCAALMFAAVVLAGCAQTTVVREEAPARGARPASNASMNSRAPAGPTYLVQPGDTLYGIAFRNGVDWRELARWNAIGEPFVIRPEQVLRLSSPRVAAVAAPTMTRPVEGRVPTSGGIVERAVTGGPPPMPRGPAQAGSPNSTQATAATDRPALQTGAPVAPPPRTAPTAPAQSNRSATQPTGSTTFRAGQWQWPTDGQVVSRFADGDKARQGVAIAGNAGQPVRAAAAGTVVYSGAGLVGYGELIIIKHSDEWLSAYGHNRRRLVAEGAAVSAGQQIAELGRTGTSRDMLHFEIRRNGKPVDPTPLLPRR